MKNPIKLEVPDDQQHLPLSLLGEKKKSLQARQRWKHFNFEAHELCPYDHQ